MSWRSLILTCASIAPKHAASLPDSAGLWPRGCRSLDSPLLDVKNLEAPVLVELLYFNFLKRAVDVN